MKNKLEKLRDDYLKSIKPQIVNINEAIKTLENGRGHIYSLMIHSKLDDGNLPFFNQKLEQINTELTDLSSRKKYLHVQYDNVNESVESVIENVYQEINSFADAINKFPDDIDGKRNIIRSYITKIQSRTDKSFLLEFTCLGTSKHKGWHAGQESNLRPPA